MGIDYSFNITSIITNAITVVLAIGGWLVGHYLTSTRDKKLKRRELITKHLIDSYRILADEITHRDASPEWDRKLELVIAELQLFGSTKQIELAKELAEKVKEGGTFYMDDLINDLRHQLRKELELEPIGGNVKWLRVNRINKEQSERL